MQGPRAHGLGIVASEEPPPTAVMPGDMPFGTQQTARGTYAAHRGWRLRAADPPSSVYGPEVTPNISEEEFWRQRNQRPAPAAQDQGAQDRAAGQERAVRQRPQSHLETLAGMLSSEGGLGEAEARARILDITEGLRDGTGGGSGASQSAAGAPDQDAAQQPGLRALEHRSTAFLQDLRQLTHALHGPPPLNAAVFLHGAAALAFLLVPYASQACQAVL